MAKYTIAHGDTLWDIAEDHGMTLAQLIDLNPWVRSHPDQINPGQQLNLGGNSPVAGPGGPIIPMGPVGTPRPQPTQKGPPTTVNIGPPGAPQPGGVQVTTPSTSYQDLLNQLGGLNGAERDAYAALSTLFTGYGLGSLVPKIITFLQQGFGSDTITSLLQQTPEYQQRFSGNQARVANGLQVLTPAEYLATEASYRQILQSAGLDPAFMTRTQYSDWIGKDISPTEVQNRVNLAVDATTNAPPELTTAFSKIGINVGDLASYFLNEKNPMPVLQQKMAQAQIMEAGFQSGLSNVNPTSALQYAKMGVTYQGALSGYQKVADVLQTANNLTGIYKSQNPYTQTQAEQEFLGSSGTAQLAREQLSRQETATFSGEGGVGQKSFAQQTAGTGF
jgi:LysM repeat protein